MIEDQGGKQIKAIENRVGKRLKNKIKKPFLDTDQKSMTFLLSENFFKWGRAKYKLNKFVEMDKKKLEINRDVLIYKTGNKKKDRKHDFQKFKIIRSFRREIYNIYY